MRQPLGPLQLFHCTLERIARVWRRCDTRRAGGDDCGSLFSSAAAPAFLIRGNRCARFAVETSLSGSVPSSRPTSSKLLLSSSDLPASPRATSSSAACVAATCSASAVVEAASEAASDERERRRRPDRITSSVRAVSGSTCAGTPLVSRGQDVHENAPRTLRRCFFGGLLGGDETPPRGTASFSDGSSDDGEWSGSNGGENGRSAYGMVWSICSCCCCEGARTLRRGDLG